MGTKNAYRVGYVPQPKLDPASYLRKASRITHCPSTYRRVKKLNSYFPNLLRKMHWYILWLIERAFQFFWNSKAEWNLKLWILETFVEAKYWIMLPLLLVLSFVFLLGGKWRSIFILFFLLILTKRCFAIRPAGIVGFEIVALVSLNFDWILLSNFYWKSRKPKTSYYTYISWSNIFIFFSLRICLNYFIFPVTKSHDYKC